LRGRQKLPHPAAEPVSLHDSEIAANEVVDQVPMSTHGPKQTAEAQPWLSAYGL